MDATERVGTVVIGGGQAGLVTGYHLKQLDVPFVILDGHQRIGDAWRTRWDSLRLFTPAKYDGLDGWPFPAAPWSFPTKDEMADYLEAYAESFDLPVRTGVTVDRLRREGDAYVIETSERRFEADDVVVATGAHHIPKVPAFAGELDPAIVQLHSKDYRNPSELRDGPVLLVGLGNSGAEIALELSKTHRTSVAMGRPTGELPVRHSPKAARLVFPLVRFLGTHVLTRRTPIGRRAARKGADKPPPLIRVKGKDLAGAGVEMLPRVVGADRGRPRLEDGRALDVANVIWCTGYRHDFPWIDLPVFDDAGVPRHERGVVTSEPGLYFVGLLFQFSKGSDVLPGVGRDAAHVARVLASRSATRPSRGTSVAGPASRSAMTAGR